MFKKIISLLCCVLPMGAVADVVKIEDSNVSSDGIVFTNLSVWQNAVENGQTVQINAGSSLNDVQAIGDYGITFSNNMVVGQASESGLGTSGNLYIMDVANANKSFEISSVRGVSIGSLLQVLDGWSLSVLGSENTATGVLDASFSAGSVGLVGADSSLCFLNLKDVKVNGAVSIASSAAFKADNVGSITVGNVNSSGILNLKTALLDQGGGATTGGDVGLGGLTVLDGTASVVAAGDMEITCGVQNNSQTSSVLLSAAGDITIGGGLENSGLSMVISNGALSVAGTMKHDSDTGKMVLQNLQSWQVLGIGADGYSFVSSNDFVANVTGLTSLASGWSLTGGVFSLTTGQMNLGANKALLNSLTDFKLNVTDGDLEASVIVNENSTSRMLLNVSGTLSADYISDNATVTGTDNTMKVSANNIVLGGQNIDGVSAAIEVVNGASSIISASNSLKAGALVTNQGNLNLSASSLELQDVANSGAGSVLKIGSPMDGLGSVLIGGNITNDTGNLILNAKNISVTGELNNKSGDFNVSGSTVAAGRLNVEGGAVNLSATSGATVTYGVTVGNGVLNLSNKLALLLAGGDVTANNIVLGGTANVAGNINVGSTSLVFGADGSVNLDNIDATNSGYSLQLASDDVNVNNVNIVGSRVAFGDETSSVASVLNVTDTVSVSSDGVFEIYSSLANISVLDNQGLIRGHGSSLIVTDSDINVNGMLRFDDVVTTGAGISLLDTPMFTLKSDNANYDVFLDGIDVKTAKTLYVESEKDLSVSSDITSAGTLVLSAENTIDIAGSISNSGVLSLNTQSVTLQNITNAVNGTVNVLVFDNVSVNSITNSGNFKIAYVDSGTAIDKLDVAGAIVNNSGNMDLYADTISAQGISVYGGNVNLYAPSMSLANNDLYVAGNVSQGGVSGNLNLLNMDELVVDNLIVTGNMFAETGDMLYKIASDVNLTGDLNIAGSTFVEFDVANKFVANDLLNSGYTNIVADNGISLSGAIVNDAGLLELDSGANEIAVDSVAVNGGNIIFTSTGLSTAGMFYSNGVLGQEVADASVIINNADYVMNLGNVHVGGIAQSGSLVINSSDVQIDGDIVASDLRIAASPVNNWMNVVVGGDVSGNVDFIGLEKMFIGNNYTFNENSALNVAVLPYAAGSGMNTTDVNYWGSISLNDDDSYGKIVHTSDASALINVGGKFVADLSIGDLGSVDSPVLEDGQFGVSLFDIVDANKAVWLLYAEGGVYNFDTNIRNMNIKFCNADGSVCVPYFNDLDENNPDGLPAYATVRDTNNDGQADSVYIVFDNQFGGPVQVFDIHPIVSREQKSTTSESAAADALDNMIAGRLEAKKFYNRTPIEVIPTVFKGTNLSQVASELYNRMESYIVERNGEALTRFSSLFEAYEIEQIATTMALNEHTVFRSFEDRMFDEFIWNRGRSLKKSWMDVDFGMFYQNTIAGNHIDGDRFSISGGFDWQESEDLILGFTGHITHSTSLLDKEVDLSYGTVTQYGNIDSQVSDTNIGLGGYFMKTFNEDNRVYGNLFADIHVVNVQRDQSFVDTIEGSGAAVSLMSEFGWMHNLLNQYFVGNVYGRVGYNSGMSITEDAAGSEYMEMNLDGYSVATAGYSLTAQKRIYPSASFQIRPYASIGAEYDVLGINNSVEYKFATTTKYSEYDIEINPLWANIGGGVEFLSARGMQVGVDYRYQYNENVQLHNIKVSGSYRF
ncbi:MAG: hypothetical protein IKZ34_03675 [Alphaproteobacteria bacterium]|nr:hypothetical protein [Alphaproteobacteria bacterium]